MPESPSLPYGPCTALVRHFLQRLAPQPPVMWLAAARQYELLRGTVDGQRADRALGAAVARLGREAERDAVVGPVVQLAARAALPVGDAAADAADVEQLAEAPLAAALALLVSDALDPALVAVLYAPFDGAIPRPTL